MTPQEAVSKAIYNGYSKELEEIACKDPCSAYNFHEYILGANMEKCMKAACKDSFYAAKLIIDSSLDEKEILYCMKYITDLHHLEWIIEEAPQFIDLFKNQKNTRKLLNEYTIKNILT